MKIKNNYNCEKCLNKSICKYYDECKKYSNKDLFIKIKHKPLNNNLTLSVNCDHYKLEESTLNYPDGVRGQGYLGGIPYINTGEKAFEPYYDPNNSSGSIPNPNTNITISNSIDTDLNSSYDVSGIKDNNGSESLKNFSKIFTTKKHI